MVRFKVFVPLGLVLLLTAPAATSAGTLSHGAGEGWFAWIRSIWATIGCTVDPNGFCAQEPRSTPAEIGCGIDPSGHCGGAPAPAEIGCTLDPGGRCRD